MRAERRAFFLSKKGTGSLKMGTGSSSLRCLSPFFIGNNFEIDCLSQMKLTAEKAPPAKMKRAVVGWKIKMEASAMTKARMRISKGILRRIFSSSEFVIVILL